MLADIILRLPMSHTDDLEKKLSLYQRAMSIILPAQYHLSKYRVCHLLHRPYAGIKTTRRRKFTIAGVKN